MDNGCGPVWFPQFLKDWLFNWFFEASCNKHDEGYRNGGDEVRRFECDWKFWQAMKRDTLKQRGLKRFIRWLQALLFFMFVRTLGWTRFNYKEDTQ